MASNWLGLDSQVAVVSGGGGPVGGGNLGQAIALELAKCGMHICILDNNEEAARNTETAIKTVGGNCHVAVVELTDERAVARAIAGCTDRFGRIDALIHNAAVGTPGGVDTLTLADWQRTIDINLTSAYLTSHFVVPKMRQQKSGAIVSISTLAALGGVGTPTAAYSATKAGLGAMTRDIAADNAKYGIRANTVIVGMIDTPMIRRYIRAELGEEAVAEEMANRGALVPMGQQGSVSEIANIVAFLVSPRSSYITGADIVADGGSTAIAL